MNSEIQIQLAELKAAQDHLEQAVRQTVELLSDTSLDFEERQQAYFKIENIFELGTKKILSTFKLLS